MQAPRKRTALLASIAVGAVATMGLGFAAWTDQLNVNATVGTGTLNVEWDKVNSNNAACVTTHTAKGIDVTVNNASPGLLCDITTAIVNEGTVDAKVIRITTIDFPGITLTNDIPNGVVIKNGTPRAAKFTLEVKDGVAQGLKDQKLSASIDFENAT